MLDLGLSLVLVIRQDRYSSLKILERADDLLGLLPSDNSTRQRQKLQSRDVA